MHTLKAFMIMFGFLLSCAFVREQQARAEQLEEPAR